jgi:RNA polymerase sigma-70 factor (ECF subfamily)
MTMTAASRSDAELLRAARRDPDAFTAFYRSHAEWLERWLQMQVRDPHLAADLTAETFAQALVSLPRFKGTDAGTGTAWLFGIARNLLRRSYEQRRVESGARTRLNMPVLDYLPEEYEAAEERLDAASFAAELESAVGSLSTELREAVELRVLGDLSYGEIALATGISEQNARKRVSRALRALTLRIATNKETTL